MYFYYDNEAYTNNGFYYTESVDHVRCFSCNVGLKDWNDVNADPLLEHVRFSPECQFLTDMLDHGVLETIKSEYKTGSHRQYQRVKTDKDTFFSVQYSVAEARKTSMNDWSNYLSKENIESIAEQGYYYTGLEDKLCCAYCDNKENMLPGCLLDIHNKHKPGCHMTKT